MSFIHKVSVCHCYWGVCAGSNLSCPPRAWREPSVRTLCCTPKAGGKHQHPLPDLVPGDAGGDRGLGVHQALETKTMAQVMQRGGGAGFVVKQFSLWGCVDHLLSVVLTAQQLTRNLVWRNKEAEGSPTPGAGPRPCESITLCELPQFAPAWDVIWCCFVGFFSGWYWILLHGWDRDGCVPQTRGNDWKAAPSSQRDGTCKIIYWVKRWCTTSNSQN